MSAPAILPPRFWIFQATPERYDLGKNLTVNREEKWTSGQYGNRMKPNDIAYFLQSGEDSRFNGWGYVKNVNPKNTREITVQYWGNFETPVQLSGLASDPELQYISRLRFSQGTVFKLTSLEADALNNYFRSMKLDVPDNELQEVMPLNIIEEYNLSGTPMKLINGALQYRGDTLDISELVTAFLKLLLERSVYAGNREDSIAFLLRFVDEEALSKMVEERLSGSMPQDFLVEKQPSSKLIQDTGDLSVYLNIVRMLQQAKEYAIRTTRSERIFSRHFLVALWSLTDLESILTGMMTDFSGFKQDLLNYLPKRYQEDNIGQWKEILLDTTNGGSFEQFIARLNSDDAEGDDLLNIKPDVESLASVITAKDIGPPLAIGLFGDWGSGKTFFMKKLKSRIGFLSENSRKNPEVTTSYCSNVISIWFNAWHYLDSNLWASLIDHIFNSLENHIKERQDEARKSNKEFHDPLVQLITVQQLKNEADEKKILIEKKQEDLKDRKEEIEGKKLAIEKKAKVALTKKGWDKVLNVEMINKTKELVAKLSALHNQWDKGNKEFLEKLKPVEDKLEEKTLKLSELQKVIAEATQLTGDSKKVWQRILVNLPYWKIIIIFGVVLGISALGFIYLQDGFVTLIAQLVSIAGLLVGFTRNQLNMANGLLDITDNLRESSQWILDQNEKDREKEMVFLNDELNRLNDSIISTDEQLNAVNEEVASLIQMEKKLSSARRLVNFINDRARSEDYSRHLGLISMVRKDFEELTKLMFPPEEENNSDYTPPIERIVLYIDDLDRCSEEKVMEVLQAVHLLLAFRLFVVVVGVDARWVSRSIKQVYPHLLNEWERDKPDKDNGMVLSNVASTQDYLEKIFQIPFWLKVVDSSDLVTSLIKGTLKSIESSSDEIGKKKGVASPQGEGKMVPQQYTTEDVTYEEFDPNPEFLMLNENELNFMSSLGTIAGMSPRAIKRYLNLYRLIKGTYRDMQLPTFNEKGGGYSEVQLILALQSGYALLFMELFELMTATNKRSFRTFINEIKFREGDENWNELIQKLQNISVNNSISISRILEFHPRISRYSFHYQKI